MKKLLSLPPNLVSCFHEVTGLTPQEFFCTSDPAGCKLGSGGGTAWLLLQAFCQAQLDGMNAFQQAHSERGNASDSFAHWLAREKRILIHGGGQSRRLPAYAPSSKLLTPVPVFRWERGQRLGQDLLSLQLPLYEQLMAKAPDSLHTLVASGDVYLRATQPLQPVPEADVVCYGLWLDAVTASRHGVYVSRRSTPHVLDHMLQKPSVEQLNELQKDYLFLTDIGVWLLSDKAVKLLMERSMRIPPCGEVKAADMLFYDMYSDFGRSLGVHPLIDDSELRDLSVAVVPLPGGEFYHFGTSREMISSTLTIQNLIRDQRAIMHHDRKPHPSIFVQNSVTHVPFTKLNSNIWIENSCIGKGWVLSSDHVITGVPENDWHVSLQPGTCLDIVPIGVDDRFAVRIYHIDDRFDGEEQLRPLFCVVTRQQLGETVEQLTSGHPVALSVHPRISAEEITSTANLQRLFAQRQAFRNSNWQSMAANWEHSVFYQVDLDDAARQFEAARLPMPDRLPDSAPLMTRIHDAMFRGESDRAFTLLRQGLCSQQDLASPAPMPRLSVCLDQIVWARSPVRIDIAGGWTDTPPYCLLEGGNVVNLAIELNGQPPLQVYVKPAHKHVVILHSIDLGCSEVVETYEQLSQYNKVGSPFSIPKAALVLAGFHADGTEGFPTLQAQLEAFGCGIELTLLSAIPAGSGLGTSSILAATVLGALSDFCSLAWDKTELGRRTLMLEQMLTTGGGWQDQFGGVLGGVKLLQSQPGFRQHPMARWLPADLYTQPEYAACHLLYYTGITRTAKGILAEIVRRMFLNQGDQLRLLRQMKQHALDMSEAILRQDFSQMGLLLAENWRQNQLLDSGTNPVEVARLTSLVDDLCLGYKLPGAGGGGYLYMVAKDVDAAARIKRILGDNRRNGNARFVDMTLSNKGLQISRS